MTPCSGLLSSMGWSASQVSTKAGLSLRTSGRSTILRKRSPSVVTSDRTRVTWSVACTTWFTRSFATRKLRVS